MIIVVKNEDNIFKKTGLRHIIVNCQLSIVNSAKPFKHQFFNLPSRVDKHKTEFTQRGLI